MSAKRRIQIFSAGCGPCGETVALVRRITCSSCDVQVLDMHDPKVADKTRKYRRSDGTGGRSGWPTGRVLRRIWSRRGVVAGDWSRCSAAIGEDRWNA